MTDDDQRLDAEMRRAQRAHLSPVDLRIAQSHGVKPDDIDGPPVGALIADMPSLWTVGRRPLSPWPTQSAGGRLLAYSELAAGQYLGRFVRRYLIDENDPRRPWNAAIAKDRAWAIADELAKLGSWRVVLVGERVREAFGVELPWQYTPRLHLATRSVLGMIAIPNPVGLERGDSEAKSRIAVGYVMRWCAGYIELPGATDPVPA